MLRFVIALVLAVGVAHAHAAEKRVALVIGNGGYASVPKLDNAGRDADAVAKALRDAGFDAVQVEENLGRDAMLAALRKFEAQVDQADWALVYFAGHGLEVGGANYLIPIDARLRSDRDVEDEAISLGQVQKRIESARKLRIVILDACRENPFVVPMRKTIASRSVGRGLARPDLPQTGSLVAFAAGTGQIALDGDATTNSPYAAALVKNLAQPDVEVNLFFRRVRADVLRATGQKQEPATYESLPDERFVFRPGAAVAAAPPAPTVAPPPSAQPSADAAFLDMIAGVTDRAMLERLVSNPVPAVQDAARKRLAALLPSPTPEVRPAPAPRPQLPVAINVSGPSPLSGASVSDVTAETIKRFSIAGAATGIVIVKVEADTPAAGVGFQAGDVIVALNDTKIGNVTDLSKVVAGKRSSWKVTLVRAGQTMTAMFGG